MTNEDRVEKIKEIFSEISVIEKEWNSKVIKLRADNFESETDRIIFLNRWNELDLQINPLYKKMRELQTKYEVDFISNTELEKADLTMNVKVNVDTFKNGWEQYSSDFEFKNLIIDVKIFLIAKGFSNPVILEIKNVDKL